MKMAKSCAALRPWLLLATLGACVPVVPSEVDRSRALPNATAVEDDAAELHGRVETHEGLRVLRLWGTPEQRGYAHGYLLAADIASMMNQEFAARFAAQPAMLVEARKALPRLIEYPEPIRRELDALWQGVVAAGVDRAMPELGRAFDEHDLLVANALDVFGLMGCSSFTVWGDKVQGGGVLTARNFDWPLTGAHMLEHTILIVQMPENAWGSASVAWPGYVGTVTGVSVDGVAAYLHVGTGVIALPEPSSWPSAIAARAILESPAVGERRFDVAAELLEYTSPPAGFLTHVVLPEAPNGDAPARCFETDVRECVPGAEPDGELVVTNHFVTREDGRRASRDSKDREQTVEKGIAGCMAVGDKVVDTNEAWDLLDSVAVGGKRRFGTLHSLVFRHEPWFFELRVADQRDGKVVAAPESGRRYRLTREQVFGGAANAARPR